MRARGRRPRSGGRGPAAAWGRGRRVPGGLGCGPRPPNCASLRLQVLVQELEQYQVCAARRRPARRVPCVPCRPCPGAARPAPPPPAPPPPAWPRAVVTCVRLGSLQLLPKRLDWEGNEHNRSYEELVRVLTFPSRYFRAPAPRPLFGAPAGGRSDRAALGGGGRAARASPGRRDSTL